MKHTLHQRFEKHSSLHWTKLLLLTALVFAISGCGGGAMSQRDMLKYGISRSDDDDEDTDDGTIAASTPTSTPPVSNAQAMNQAIESRPSLSQPAPADSPTVNTVTAQPATTTNAVAADVASSTSESVLATAVPVDGDAIASRRPANPLSQQENRQKTAANIDRITDAILSWMDSSYKVPRSVILDRRGLPGLSWRVQILPLLGYETLYNRFDLKEPWDSPTNKPLLDLIPDEYVNYNRFDTNTNLQLFVNGTALFSESEEKDKSEISDAPKIALLAEVDDAMAVPWTAPFDYEVTTQPLDRGLGNMRSDGLFVGWMTGDAALWPAPIDPAQLMRAITFEAGDGINFARYLGYPPPMPGGSARPQFVSGSSTPSSAAGFNTAVNANNNAVGGTAVASNYGNRGGSRSTHSIGGQNNYVRVPMPSKQEILEAEQKVRETYVDAFKLARTPAEFASLAKRIESQVSTLELPPAELFVGLRTAMNVAIKARDPQLGIRTLDLIDAQFEVDRHTFEAALIKGFIGDKGTLRTELSKSSALLPMLRSVVSNLVEDDDYRTATEFVGYGSQLVRVLSDREAAYQWKMLSERVKTGKQIFPKIANQVEVLSKDPDDAKANYLVGWYFCLIKDNWNEGLQMLAQSNNDELRNLAQLEAQTDMSLIRHLRIADSWWDYAEQHKDEDLAFEASLRRARKWYTSAAIGLADGLDRIRANNRLVRIDNMIGRDQENLVTRSSLDEEDN